MLTRPRWRRLARLPDRHRSRDVCLSSHLLIPLSLLPSPPPTPLLIFYPRLPHAHSSPGEFSPHTGCYNIVWFVPLFRRASWLRSWHLLQSVSVLHSCFHSFLCSVGTVFSDFAGLLCLSVCLCVRVCACVYVHLSLSLFSPFSSYPYLSSSQPS